MTHIVNKEYDSDEYASLVFEHYKAISPFVPNKIKKDGNIISYEYVEGKTLNETNDDMGDFAEWCLDNLWEYSPNKATEINKDLWCSIPLKIISNMVSQDVFLKANKIIERIADSIFIPARIHGDLHPLNVIKSKEGNYILIDVEPKTCNKPGFGNMMYDMAKFTFFLLMPPPLVYYGRYSLIKDGDTVKAIIDYDVKGYINFVEAFDKKGIDPWRIEKMAGLLIIGRAAFHSGGKKEFMFYRGLDILLKDNQWES